MSGEIKIVVNQAGVRALLQGPEMQALIASKAAAIAAAAGSSGGEFGHDVVIGANRVHGVVWTADHAAQQAEATDRALTRAIDAGRG